jgi:hypothetical protein
MTQDMLLEMESKMARACRFFCFFRQCLRGKTQVSSKEHTASPSLAPLCLRALAPLCPLNLVPSRPVSDVWFCCVWVCGS